MNNQNFADNSLIILHGRDWFEKQKIAGEAVATCLFYSKKLVEAATPNLTLKDLESECEKILNKFDCLPTFKDYKGFPGSVCISVNKQLVHGIPNEYKIQNGDVVTVDIGATYDGVIADAAATMIYGSGQEKHKRLIEACNKSLYVAIDAIRLGKQLGVIGHNINKQARAAGYALITKYAGHGLSLNNPHAAPFVPNKAHYSEGIRIQPGLSIAIEPMFVIGSSNKTTTDKDGWTVLTKNISAHAEHTVFVGEDKVHIMTDHKGISWLK